MGYPHFVSYVLNMKALSTENTKAFACLHSDYTHYIDSGLKNGHVYGHKALFLWTGHVNVSFFVFKKKTLKD